MSIRLGVALARPPSNITHSSRSKFPVLQYHFFQNNSSLHNPSESLTILSSPPNVRSVRRPLGPSLSALGRILIQRPPPLPPTCSRPAALQACNMHTSGSIYRISHIGRHPETNKIPPRKHAVHSRPFLMPRYLTADHLGTCRTGIRPRSSVSHLQPLRQTASPSVNCASCFL